MILRIGFAVLISLIGADAFGYDVAKVSALSKSEVWLKLLHTDRYGKKSEVVSDGFFISKHGRRDPQAELIATINALQSDHITGDINQHALCRFPARALVIQQHIPLTLSISPHQCTDYVEWRSENIRSVSLLFVTGYLGNPASYFGHILLKVNHSDSIDDVNLNDNSVNFGAIGTDSDHILKYVVKGLLGGYKAAFSDQKFYRHTHAYGESQFRDVWEYELSLTDAQRALLLAHLWEIFPHRYTYFFLKENCAFRIAEMIELVIGEELVSKTYPFSIPYSVFDKLTKVQTNGSGIVRAVRYIPSLQKRFAQKFEALNSEEQSAVKELTKPAEFDLRSKSYQSLEQAQKLAVLEALLDYFHYLSVKEEDESAYLFERNIITRERLSMPAGITHRAKQPSSPPHHGVRPSLVRVGHAINDGESTQSLTFRPVYYDFLSPDYGRLSNSELIALQIQLEYRDRDIELESFELLNIHTLNTSQTGLPGDKGYAWQIRTSYKDLANDCRNTCRALQGVAGIGLAEDRGWFTGYAMSNIRVHQDRQDAGEASIQAELGGLLDLNRYLKLQLKYTRTEFFQSTALSNDAFVVKGRLFDSKYWDLRFSFEKREVFESRFEYSYYF